ncbi:PREDICTED: protein IQ-DOMAIN 31-like [Camelina sativa]|uniref:Protein IQ-DOMAIN 31-like n=1 Tax=Camelina sativa TaxID=90675 RepID=A0ABM0TMA3_CAMSA|nr:PREDICTED: protein IQ-DOMAIN 31-like [Camelina sativa]
MGKSTKWLKNVLLGKKTSKSSGSKGKEIVVSGKEVVVTAKVEESDVVSDLPSFAIPATNTVDRSGGILETQNVQPEEISDDEIELPEGKPTDSQIVAPVQDDSLSDAEKIQQEIAATSVQAAFRGYLARRAFWALKGIIRLQALIRGHLVRRQAVATLFSVMGIVRLQAFARGREIRKSDIGVQVLRKCSLQLLQGNKLATPTDAYFGIKKLTSNAFALKLLASSPKVIPVRAYNSSNPNSNLIWLENWSASCFWKPVPQPKKTIGRKLQNKLLVEAESAKPKKSVRKVPAASLESSSVQTSFEFEKPKRSFRKVSSQSIEPPAVEDPQIELEKVKRSLRKVHNPVVESSIQPQRSPHREVEKPKLGVEKITESSYPLVHKTAEEPVNVCDEKKNQEMPEQPGEEVHVPEVEVHTPAPLETNEALDSSLVNQIDSNERAMVEEKASIKDTKEERSPKPKNKENSAGKENQKSRKKGSATSKTEREESNGDSQTSPSIPSYMQATKSAKAKLRLQGSPKSAEQDGTEKATVPRRHSLPSSGNGRITSNSPRTTRLTNSGEKTGNKKEKPLLSSREGNAKTTPAERKR